MKSETIKWFKKQVFSEHYFEDNFFENKVYLDYFALNLINEKNHKKLNKLNIKNLRLNIQINRRISKLNTQSQ